MRYGNFEHAQIDSIRSAIISKNKRALSADLSNCHEELKSFVK